MSIEQVRDLPTFRNWTVYDDRIVKYNHTLGERKYDVKLLFGNNQLYAIRFTSTSFENAVHLNTSIKMMSIISKILSPKYTENLFLLWNAFCETINGRIYSMGVPMENR